MRAGADVPRSLVLAAPLLVVAIARLGEADLSGWWRSHGLDAVGDYALPDLFPRTAMVAGTEIAVLSAAKRHSDALPDRDDVVHLFGEPLPAFAGALAWLSELKTGGEQGFFHELRSWTSLEVAHGAMADLTGERPPGERLGGTVRLGAVTDEALADPRQVGEITRALAAAYVGQGRDLSVPYYDLE